MEHLCQNDPEQKEKKVIKGQVKMAGFAQAEYAAHQINARRLSYEKNQPIKVNFYLLSIPNSSSMMLWINEQDLLKCKAGEQDA